MTVAIKSLLTNSSQLITRREMKMKHPVERQAASKSDEETRFFNTSFYLHLPFSVPVGTFFVFKFANFTKRANCSTDYE